MGGAVNGPVLALAALGAGALGWAVFHQHPRLAVGSWLAVVCFVPVWLGVDLGLFLTPATVAGVLVLSALLPRLRGARVGLADGIVLTMFAAAAVAFALSTTNTPAFFALLSESLLAYLLGRVVVDLVGEQWLYLTVAVLFACVAVLAVVEFAASWNPFVGLARGNSLYGEWGTIQVRGGLNRAEGAFGHSIALGCSLALALPFVLASRLRTAVKLPVAAVMLLGAAVSFSRVGLLAAVLAVGLSVLVLRGGMTTQARLLVVAGGAAVAAAVAPLVLDVLDSAGDEATGSAAYRGDLLTLLPSLVPLGESEALVRFADGSRRFGTFRSIDNELLLFALQFGWLPLLAAVLGLVAAVLAVLTRRATPALVSVVAVLPALGTVALITQYRMWFFFVVGVAAATQVARGRGQDAPVPPTAAPGSEGTDAARTQQTVPARLAEGPRPS